MLGITGTAAATDPDNPILTYSLVGMAGGAANGTVVFTNPATGAYTYTPNAKFNGTDTFTFKANDGSVDSNNATITVTVTEVNDAPTANNDTIADIAEDSGARVISSPRCSRNDSKGPANESGQNLTITNVAVGSGTIQIVGTDVIFTPTANYNGPASFTYTVSDNGTTNGAADPLSAHRGNGVVQHHGGERCADHRGAGVGRRDRRRR